MVVENRPGASGMIGTEAVSRAAPDGITLLMTANTYLIDAQMRKASYHPVTNFEPICFLVESPAVLVVNRASPYRTLADLLSAGRAKPAEIPWRVSDREHPFTSGSRRSRAWPTSTRLTSPMPAAPPP